MSIVVEIVAGIYLVMSFVTFVVYGWDKRQATREGWRVKERTLHLMELFCGWPGALVARTIFRHKRRKLGFSIVTALIVLLHLAVWSGIYLVHWFNWG